MPAILLMPYVIIEALAFWAVASWIGWGWALLAIVALFFLGIILSSIELRTVVRRLMEGESPGRTLADTGLIIVGSGLLIAPGFVTALLGLILVFPPTRGLVRRIIGRRFRRWVEKTAEDSFVYIERFGAGRFPGATGFGGANGFGGPGTMRHEVIDADDFKDITPEDITGPRDGGTDGTRGPGGRG